MEENASNRSIFKEIMIENVPNYANRFLYSLGFLSMICFVILTLTGIVMVFYGPTWWLTNNVGKFMRSIHLWATQGFVIFMILHLIIVIFTSAYRRPRRLTWVLGALLFFFVLAETEFGYVLRGDFSSQWRSLQGADLYNGSGIGAVLNALNYYQMYGIHIAFIPLVILAILFGHYLFIRFRGIAKPYREDVPYQIVPANHKVLFIRGFVLVAVIIILAVIFPSPYLHPTTIQEIAQKGPALLASTLEKEFDRSSDTATYLDSIDPYTYDTRSVYITAPYDQLVAVNGAKNLMQVYNSEPKALQDAQLKAASDYFSGTQTAKPDLTNPVIAVIMSLVPVAQSGLYESTLSYLNPTGDRTTYGLRFLADTGAMDDQANALGITTEQYGMLKEETRSFPLGAWWLVPIGLLDHTILANDPNQDRDGAIIIGLLVFLLIAFPYIPYVNRIPDKLRLYKLVWWGDKSK